MAIRPEIGAEQPTAVGPEKQADSSNDDTVARYFWRKVAERGNQVAMRHKYRGVWKSTSWREYGALAKYAGLGLASIGVRRGEVVSILSDGAPEWLFADRGIQAIGAISNAIHATDTQDRVAEILTLSRTGVCIVENAEQLQKLIEIRAALPALRKIVVFNFDGLYNFRDAMVLSFQQLLDEGREYDQSHPEAWDRELAIGAAEEPAVVAYSMKNGASGPRGALLSHANLMFLVRHGVELWSQSPEDFQLNLLPLANLTERVLSALLPLRSAAVVHFVESASTVDENLREVQPNFVFADPRLWERIMSHQMVTMEDSTGLGRWAYGWALAVGRRAVRLRASGKSLSAMQKLAVRAADLLVLRNVKRQYGLAKARSLLVGVDVLADEVISWFAALGLDLRPVYGLSESSGLAAISASDLPPMSREVKSLRDTDSRLDENGQILLRGPHIFMGYLDGASTSQIDGGWLQTGDVGQSGEAGSMSIVGRLDDMIAVQNGRIVSPAAIEAKLRASPYIAAAMLIGDGASGLNCLVLPDHETVAHYAQKNNVPFTNFASLCAAPDIQGLIRAEIDKANASFSPADRIRDFRVIDHSFAPDDREIAKGVRLDRAMIANNFRSLIDDLRGAAKPIPRDFG